MASIGKHALATILGLLLIAYLRFLIAIGVVNHWAVGFVLAFVFGGTALFLVAIYKPKLQSSYFDARTFEHGGEIYRWAGVRLVVVILRLVGVERIQRKGVPVRRSHESLQKYLHRTRLSETVHLLAGFLMAVFTIAFALRYSFVETAWLWIANIAFHLYPVMLQRYNRPRVERLIRIMESRSPSFAC